MTAITRVEVVGREYTIHYVAKTLDDAIAKLRECHATMEGDEPGPSEVVVRLLRNSK